MAKDIVKQPTLPATVDEAVGLPAEQLKELDHSALPNIVNDGESFKVRNGNWKITGDSFNAVILDMTEYQFYKCSNENHAINGFYTYDGGQTASNGDRVEDILKLWEQDGCSYSVHDYVRFHVLLVDEGETFNALAMVSISPTSVKRAKAYLALELGRQRRLQPFQAVTRFGMGDFVVGKGGKKFRPWELSFVEEFDIEEFNKKLEAA